MYTFTMYDSFRDGICCALGKGWYSLNWRGQKIVDGDGQFGSRISHSFGESADVLGGCADDPRWLFRGDHTTCDWVAASPSGRCNTVGVIGKTKKNARLACPVACNLCSTCNDDPRWKYQRTKTCKWVAGSPSTRCNRGGMIGKTRTNSFSACPVACNQCSTCADDPRWKYQGDKTKTCDWVADSPFDRCSRVGKIGKTRTNSFSACPAACNQCSTCADDPRWLFRADHTTCDWVAENPSARCSRVGKIGKNKKNTRLACPVACNSC
jgi:hypothetical protein